MNFNSHTDAVIAVAVALVNTLTPGERRGRAYRPPAGEERRAAVAEALRTGSRVAEVTPEEAGEFCDVARELREVFEGVARGDVDAAAVRLNALLEKYEARPHLDRHDGEPWHLHFHGAGGTAVRDWAASCATGLAIVLGGELYDRLGVCTAPACDRVYVDVSRNGTRRFCSTACQNRVKTAAFRARAGA
ncbi:putative RNA-binding Zn ribbon-like protein [Thermocatellispora tengchongensis]|uniref:Putative RNA-binding Zn ribbon-like protein n=1 Tax=Thermocatellispora tengchongensis TaxID=1073253 RepID=A0A840P1A9_9ACTN|nr:CGNR zinc finger domain-containing protein [Thermocatellispora tengchongensis]MBB5131037.1 putative RNA-binding Zn ribbon-like protein [Thermocatellispora tengchongensis]